MGSASAEMEMHAAATRHADISPRPWRCSRTANAHGHASTMGYVLVLENATELLRAQKQSAWKEVARRVAHEIKNPLTPISL